MIITLYAIAPKSKQHIPIGTAENKVATFHINPKRYFQKADCMGRDVKILPKKEIDWCNVYVFKLDTGETYRISKDDFMGYCWLFPKKDDPEYKANSSNFAPKLMITKDVAEFLNKKYHEDWIKGKAERDRLEVLEAMK